MIIIIANWIKMSTPQQAIQADWENREFVETISTGIKRIAEFLSNFGAYVFVWF